jgi:hypothetical protein
METMTETALEKRIDYLREETHRGFDQVDRRFVRVEADIRELRSDMKSGFDSLHRLMIRFFAGTLASIIAGVIVLLASHS